MLNDSCVQKQGTEPAPGHRHHCLVNGEVLRNRITVGDWCDVHKGDAEMEKVVVVILTLTLFLFVMQILLADV